MDSFSTWSNYRLRMAPHPRRTQSMTPTAARKSPIEVWTKTAEEILKKCRPSSNFKRGSLASAPFITKNHP